MPEEVKQPHAPVCPECIRRAVSVGNVATATASELHIAANILQVGPITTALLWCADCGHPLHFQVISFDQPRISPPGMPRPVGRG